MSVFKGGKKESQKPRPMRAEQDIESQEAIHMSPYRHGYREIIRNHAPCGRGRAELQEVCHIWVNGGGDREKV